MTSMTASATSAITSAAANVMARRAGCTSRAAFLERRHQAFHARVHDRRESEEQAGRRRHAEREQQHAADRRSTSLVRGRLVGYARISACTPTRASNRPSAPPAIDSSTPSVMNCRSSRPRLAPSAVRTANSRCRASARASSRLARFAHAISSTRPTAACSTQIARLALAEDLVLQRLHLKDVAAVLRAAGRRRGSCAPVRSPQFWMSASSSVCAACGGDAVLQPSDEIQEVVAAVLTIGRVQPERQPDLGAVVHDVGARRHDADDFAAPAVDFDRLPDDRPPAKRGLPQLVRENRDARRRRRGLSRRGRRAADVGFSLREQASLRRPARRAR